MLLQAAATAGPDATPTARSRSSWTRPTPRRYAGDAEAAIEAARRAARPERERTRQRRARGPSAAVASLLEGSHRRSCRAALGRCAAQSPSRIRAGWRGPEPPPRWSGDEALESALYLKAVTRARASAAVITLNKVLEVFTFAAMLEGRYGAVAADATEGLQLAREAGLTNSACHHLATLAWVAAIRGQEAQCREPRAGGGRRPRPTAASDLQRAIAEWALGAAGPRARPAGASAAPADAVNAAGPGAGHPFIALCAAPDLIESAVRAGRPDDARAALVRLERFGGPDAPAWALPLVARCRALLAPPPRGTATSGGRSASAAQSRRAFDRARTELLFGEHLRRTRRRVEARDHLAAALAEFERVGAAPWAERAHRELRASGADGSQAGSERRQPADGAGGPDRTLRRARRHQPGSRGAAVPEQAHRRLPPAPDLREARDLVAQRARGARAVELGRRRSSAA